MVFHSFPKITMVGPPRSLFKYVSFLVRHPVAISVLTAASGDIPGVVWLFYVFCMFWDNGLRLGYAWHYHKRVGSWLVMEHVINMSREVHINDTLMLGYEHRCLYVPCSYLRVVVNDKVRN